MTGNFKQMVVVLAIAIAIFRFGKPIALLFSTESDFSRRRNVWFALTVTAFLSPSFWLFALVAIPVLSWAGRRDTNPVALYLILLQVIPPIPVEIPVVGINELFSLDNYRLLSFCVLIPAAWRLRKLKDTARIRGLDTMDFSLLAFGALNLLIYVPPDLPSHVILTDSATNVIRRAFLFLVDVYVLYFVVSRSCCSRRTLIESMSAFCLAGALMASLAVFETSRRWLLYSGISEQWGIHPAYGPQYIEFFVRGNFLRAQASAGHALSLGYLLAITFGFWLYIQSFVKSKRWRILVALLLCLGLLATQARGPLIGAIGIYVAYAALGPRAMPRLLKAVGVVALVVGAASLTPFGATIIDSIPYLGNSPDEESVDYRLRLAERSWELIQMHPFLGDQLAMSKMEDLRQGQGIIDIVNTYAGVTLFSGLIGLVLFLAVILIGLFKVYRMSKEIMRRDQSYALLGISLMACIFGTLFTLGSSSFVFGYAKMFYVLAGLAAAYAYVGKLSERR